MNWQQVAKRLAGAAPALGAALAGPAGGVVGAVIADKLGVAATPAAVARQIEADPDAMARLAEVEADLAKAAMADTQDARQAHKGHWLPPALTLGLVAAVAALTAALFFLNIPAENRDMLNFALGNFFGWASAAIAYWIGSSRGSAEKQDILSRRD